MRAEVEAAVDTAEHLRDLLAEVFSTLKRHYTQGRIASLCLRIAARTESADGELSEENEYRNWRSVWKEAQSTFNTTMEALSQS